MQPPFHSFSPMILGTSVVMPSNSHQLKFRIPPPSIFLDLSAHPHGIWTWLSLSDLTPMVPFLNSRPLHSLPHWLHTRSLSPSLCLHPWPHLALFPVRFSWEPMVPEPMVHHFDLPPPPASPFSSFPSPHCIFRPLSTLL